MRYRQLLIGLVILALAAACSGGDAEEAASGAAESAIAEMAAEGRGVDDGGDGGDESGGDGAETAAGEDAALAGAAGEGQTEGGEPPAVPVGEPIRARTGERVIKEGTVTIEVDAGRFDTAYAAVISEARTLGGSVVSSSTTNSDDGGTSGSITVQVPVERYEDLLVGVAEIGEIRERSISAEDVSTEYVDLQSRRRHLEAQERFYLQLLEEAADVQDAIAVQQQLDDLQSQLEQIKGRLQYLNERTSYSTLTVELFEPGATLVLAETDTTARPSLAHYWATAQDAFVNTVGTLLVAVTFLLPLALIAGVAALVWRGVRRRPVATAGEEPSAGAV